MQVSKCVFNDRQVSDLAVVHLQQGCQDVLSENIKELFLHVRLALVDRYLDPVLNPLYLNDALRFSQNVKTLGPKLRRVTLSSIAKL